MLTEDGNDDICSIKESKLGSSSVRVFGFKHLKYEMIDFEPVPLALGYQKDIEKYIKEAFLRQGLSQAEIEAK